jgi:hypothetical protein
MQHLIVLFSGIATLPHLLVAQQNIMFKTVDRDGTSREVDPRSLVDPAVSNLNYDNYLPTIFGGSVAIRGSTPIGFDETGDDVNMIGDVGVLNSMGMGISNRSRTNSFGLAQFTVRARSRIDGTVIGQTSFAFDLGMPANTFLFFSLPEGLFTSANIQLSPQIWLTVQWNFIQGATSAADIHGIYGAPQVLGSSSSMIRNFTTGADIDLGGGGLPNSFMWYVATSPVPSPGAIVVLATGAALAARRRERG